MGFFYPEKTGGSKNVTLKIDQIPAHSHTTKYRYIFWDGGSQYQIGKADPSWSGEIQYNALGTTYYYTNNTGGGKSHTNLQPYFTCYIWKRTA